MNTNSTTSRPTDAIPYVAGDPLIGNLRHLRADPFGFTLRTIARYGDITRYRFLNTTSFVVNHPDDIQHVLQTNSRNYTKQTPEYEMLRPVVGNGLLTSDGDFWLRQRRLMQPAFHRKRILDFGDMITDASQAMVNRWRAAIAAGSSIALDRELMQLTLTIAGKALIGMDLGDGVNVFGQAFKQANHRYGYDNALSVLLPWLPTRPNREFRAAVRTMNNVVNDLITQRRRDPTPHDDLLSMLLEAQDEDTGETMTDQQVRDELMTILLAGHETTANALTWAFYLLSQHPDAAARVHAEVDAVLGGRAPTADDLPRLEYARMVIQETLRLYPPAWSIGRRAIEDDVLSGYRFPAGGALNIVIYAVHRHRQFWEDPEAFRPERFTEEASRSRHKFAYMPFSGGPRKCIGDQFAMFEAQLILATVAQQVDLTLTPGHRVELNPLITLTPKYGMQMIPRHRGATHIQSAPLPNYSVMVSPS